MYYTKSDSLDKYFKSIRDLDPLSKQEELDLARKIKKGDEKALHKLIQHNLKIVVTIANKNRGRGINVDDLIQEGNIGLLNAAHRFDPDVNVRFASFAATRVLKSMNALIDTCGRIVRIPVNQEYQRYLAIRDGKEVDNIRSVKIDDLLSDDSNTTKADILLSVDPTIDDDHNVEFFRKKVNKLLSKLKDRDLRIIKLYYGLDTGIEVPTREIAKQVGLTQVRVCQILNAARKTLKKNYKLDKSI